MEIINSIKKSWKKNKVETGFMGLVILFAILTYLKPDYTGSILANIGLSIVNFLLLALGAVGLWYFLWRKN